MSRRSIRDCGNVLQLPGALWDSGFLRACRGEPVAVTPVWLMRQAGRYMPHYRSIRARCQFLALCKDPALSAEVAIYAREFLGVDAAIVFSDILVVLEAMGMALEFPAGEGPQLPRPLTQMRDIEQLRSPQEALAELGYVHQAVRLTVAGLPGAIPCIGFCGGPFTLASYAIEGGSSRQFARTKAFMYREPRGWRLLMERLVGVLGEHLRGQITAGASCVQIFESWAGALTRADFSEFLAPYLRTLISQLPDGVPVISFAAGASHLQDLIASCGGDVLGIDSHGDLAGSFGWRDAQAPGMALQGNLDPCLLLAPRERLLAATHQVLAQARGRAGYIFNLGHGVLKETAPEHARLLVDAVHHGEPSLRS